MTRARDLSKLLGTANNGVIPNSNLGVSFENISDTGTTGTKVASGTTAQRGSTAGQIRFNSETGLAEYYDGTNFKSIDAPPTVTAVSPLEVESDVGGNVTFTITGTNFGVGAVAKFIGSDATEITASSTTVTNSTTISAVIAKSSFVNAKEPYDVKIINGSGLSATLDNQISVDVSPVWSTASGTLATISDANTGTHSTVSATDADGDTVSYSETGGTVLTTAGLTLNSSTGAISGNPTDVGSSTTYSFNLRASAGGINVDRAFNIIVNPALDGSSSAKAPSTSGNGCLQVLNNRNSYGMASSSGAYWIKPTGSSAYQVYCDMTTDGGGWTLIMSARDYGTWNGQTPLLINNRSNIIAGTYTTGTPTSLTEQTMVSQALYDVTGNDILVKENSASSSSFIKSGTNYENGSQTCLNNGSNRSVGYYFAQDFTAGGWRRICNQIYSASTPTDMYAYFARNSNSTSNAQYFIFMFNEEGERDNFAFISTNYQNGVTTQSIDIRAGSEEGDCGFIVTDNTWSSSNTDYGAGTDGSESHNRANGAGHLFVR